MGEETRRSCDANLEASENRGLCAVPKSDAELNRFSYLKGKGELVSPYPGLFASANVWGHLLPSQRVRRVMRTLGRVHADWLFVGPSAAIVHDLAVPPSSMWPLCIAKVGSGTCKGTSLTRRTRVQACEVVVLDGMRVTTIDQTAVDCMRQLPFAAALSVADSYLRATNQTRGRLEDLVANPRIGLAGIRNARIVAAHADGRAESWGESEARAAMLELGFALPELQVPYLDPITGQWYRADFSWDLTDAGTVIGEMDGFAKYTDETMSGGDMVGAFVRERQRESRLTIGGRSVMRFTPAQVANRQYFEILLESYGIPRAKPLSGWKKLRCM